MSPPVMYNTPISTKEKRRLRRVAKRERQRNRDGHANGYKQMHKQYYGYEKVKVQTPWRGEKDNKTGKILPFKGTLEGEGKTPFYLNPLTNEVSWFTTSPPPDLIHYKWESTAKHATNITPV